MAIKLVSKFSHSYYQSLKVLREIRIMKNLSSSGHTPKLYELIKGENEGELVIFFVMEFFDSDLTDLINLGSGSGLTDEHRILIVYNFLCAVNYVHSANVLHRDIKPGNILVNKDCSVAICDFGISRTGTSKNDVVESVESTGDAK